MANQGLDKTSKNEVSDNKMVVLDDLPDLSNVLAEFAQLCGWDSYPVNSKSDFEHAIKSYNPSMVLLDVYMPHYDGVDAIGFLSERKFKGQVCFVSSCSHQAMKSMKDLAFGYGLEVAGSFSKPVDFEQLFKLLHRVR